MIKDIKPLNDKILVKRLEKENKTEGGIFFADVAEELSQWAEVVTIGTGRLFSDGSKIDLVVQPGWKVYLNKYAVQTDIEGYMIVREDDVLGYIEE